MYVCSQECVVLSHTYQCLEPRGLLVLSGVGFESLSQSCRWGCGGPVQNLSLIRAENEAT